MPPIVEAADGGEEAVMRPTSELTRSARVRADEELACGATVQRRRTVLLVDDDEAVATGLARLLRREGFDTECVFSAVAALARALSSPPNAVIVDLHMADGDLPGLLVLNSLRRRYPELVTIAMTGWYFGDEHEQVARALGASDYLLKPVDGKTLTASLQVAINDCSERVTNPREAISPAADDAGRCAVIETVEPAADKGVTPELAACEDAFITFWLPRLVRWTRHRWPKVWDDIIVEQVEDALLEFLGKVNAGIWPVSRSVDLHLRQAAWRNVRDSVQAAGRRRVIEARYAAERDLVAAQGKPKWGLSEATILARLELSTAECEAVRRWLEGDGPLRITEALGMSHLSAEDQLREVKRFKDRIKRRAKRGHQQWRSIETVTH